MITTSAIQLLLFISHASFPLQKMDVGKSDLDVASHDSVNGTSLAEVK